MIRSWERGELTVEILKLNCLELGEEVVNGSLVENKMIFS